MSEARPVGIVVDITVPPMAERGDQLDPMRAGELAEEQFLPVPRPGKLDLEAIRLSA